MTRIVQKLVQVGIVLIGVGSLLGYFGSLHRLLELANHFRLQYLLGAMLGWLLLLLTKNWRWSLVAALIVALNAWHVLPWYDGTGPVKVAGHRLKLLHFNVKYNSTEYAALLNLVKEEAPDIVTLAEVDQAWVTNLAPLKSEFPYAQIEAQDKGSGLALYSRIKLETAARDELGLSWRPGIRVSFKLENTLVHLLTIHPPTPTEAVNFPPRNQQFAGTAERLNRLPAPKILLGDLNDTVWSTYHAQLLAQTQMVNVRKGFGLLPSWPSALYFRALMIPIDHCLVSPEIVVASVRTGKDIGSDHLPLLVELVIPKK